MTKLLTEESIYKLSDKLSDAQAYSAILGRNDFLIDGAYYEGGDTTGSFMTIEYLDSGISEYIDIDNAGRVSLDNNTNEYSAMYGEDFMDIAKVTNVFTAWWKNLPETK